ncbi:tetratricopeptide repeat protein [Nocardioides sp. R-C-SC26]|uniref:tetratricopeptide repeat protein n=1 Tax=Nocardioides sp. R-C-SC26 TaxID=2870414 RepID=UPI001E61DF2D|nr:tetratricopeptide repeat protein [Nocardioides sp. R-C-SC26]
MSRTPHRLAALTLVGALAAGVAGCADDDPAAAPAGGTSSTGAADATTTLISTGLTQIQAQDYAGAQGTFTSVLALDPSNVYAHYNLGYIAQLEGRDDEARQRYEQALASDDAFAPALFNLAILTETDDLEAAVALYRRVIEASPDDAASHVRLGYALIHLGEKTEGQEMLDRGFELNPALANAEPPTYD